MIVGCQTTKRSYQQVQLPATLSQYFDACLQGDGAVNLKLFEDEELLGSADLEWIVDEGQGWKAEVVSPVGQSLLRLVYAIDANVITKEGQLAERIPSLGVDRAGYLSVNDQFIGIRAMEVPCLLKFRYPTRWLDRVTEFQLYSQSAKLLIHDELRNIEMNASGFGGPGPDTKACADISWSRFWGLFRSKLMVCNTYGSPKLGSIRGLKRLSLRWSSIDD